MRLIFWKLCRFLLMFLTRFTSLSVLLLFPLSITFFTFTFFVFNSVLSNRWGSLDQPHQMRFSVSNELTQMVNFPNWIPDCDSHIPALLDLFISSDTNICSTMAFPLLGNSDHVIVSVSVKFTMGCSVSLHSLWLFSCWFGWSSWSFERCSMGGYL